MTRWLVTGGHGQLGHRLARALADSPADDVVITARAELDITSPRSIRAALDAAHPDVIVNAAAYTAVDAAETDEDTAFAVNATAVGQLAEQAEASGARLLHISTDYVFDGADVGHAYEVDDEPAPRTAYGRTKLAGERLATRHGATVVRTSWVFGGPGANFVDTMLRLAQTHDTLDVVDDQTGSPTYSADLASALVELGRHPGPLPPTLHFSNAGTATWFDLAQAAFTAAGLDPERIRPTTSAQFVRPAPRPAWSVLSLASWIDVGLSEPAPWTDAVVRHLAPGSRVSPG